MVITIVNTLANLLYSAQMSTEFSSVEMNYAATYGEPQVDVGGVIPLVDPVAHTPILNPVSPYAPETITLPQRLTYIRSGFPVSQSFDGNVDVQAAIKMFSWTWAVQARLTAAKTALMANPVPTTPNTVNVIV